MKKLKRVEVAVAVVLVTFFWGCRSAERVSNTAAVPTRVVTDDLGRTVTIPVKVTRVVSLPPSLTENIFAVGAGDRLVGVTTFCNYPQEAKSIQKVGDTLTPNIETIIALKPDIVFVSTASQIEAFLKVLEQNGIAVYVTNPTSLDGVFENLKQLGALFGTREKADEFARNLQRRVTAVWDKVQYEKKASVFVQISKEDPYTIGRQSFLNNVIIKAGGESVTASVETAYPKLSKETALALNPEVIILSESEDNQEPNDVFKNSPAVKNGRIYKVSADILSRPGPRLVDALEQIAKDLHPDRFN